MSTKTTEQRVISIIAKSLNMKESDISKEANFASDLGTDSLDQVEIMMAFEDEYGIEIPDEDASKIKTVKDAIDYIDSKNNN